MWKTKKKPVFFLCPSKNHNPSFLWRDYDLCWGFQFYHLMEIVYTNCMYTTSKLCFNTYSVFGTKIKKGLVIYPIRFSLTKNKNKWMKKAVYIVYNWKFLCFFTFNGSKTNGTLTGKQCKFKTITISCNNLLWESSGIPAMQRIKRWNTNKKWWEQP